LQPLVVSADAGADADATHPVEREAAADDWGLVCISPLDWIGYITTSAWLSVDPERRVLALLLRREPELVRFARGILAASCAFPEAAHSINAQLFDTHAELLAFCHNNLQRAHCAARVSAQHFLCNASSQQRVTSACAAHSAELVLRYANEHAIERAIAYNARDAVGATPYTCRTPELQDIMRAFRLTTAWRPALGLCTVEARDSTGTRLLVSSAAFVSLDHYRECASRAAELTRWLQHDNTRKHRCAECALCPALCLLRSFGPGMAPPAASISTDPESLPCHDPTCDYEQQWSNPRAVHTEHTRIAGPAGMRHAVLWYFGGVSDPARVLLELVEALCHDGGTVVSALSLIQDTVLMTVEALGRLKNPGEADKIRTEYITSSLAARVLYSFHLNAAITSCALTQ
jgi:hypothetical protein